VLDWLRAQLKFGFGAMNDAMLARPPQSESNTLDMWLAAIMASGLEFEHTESTRDRIAQAFARLLATTTWWPRPVEFLREYRALLEAEESAARTAALETRQAELAARNARRLAAPEPEPAAPPSAEEIAAATAAAAEGLRRAAAGRARFLAALREIERRNLAARRAAGIALIAARGILAAEGQPRAIDEDAG